MTSLSSFSAIPAATVPGRFTPAFIGTGGLTYYRYYGHLSLYYLDYLDLSTGKTLYATPGSIYAMLPVSSRAGLSEPPPDSWRWNISSGQIRYDIPLSRKLDLARSLNAVLQASNARKPYQMFPGTPSKVVSKRKENPSPSSIATAEARALNARLQAAGGK